MCIWNVGVVVEMSRGTPEILEKVKDCLMGTTHTPEG